mgnify:CR=1 FL=1
MKKGTIKKKKTNTNIKFLISFYFIFLLNIIRYAAQNDEIARLQLDNGVLQEKLANEKRKLSMVEV